MLMLVHLLSKMEKAIFYLLLQPLNANQNFANKIKMILEMKHWALSVHFATSGQCNKTFLEEALKN